MTQFFKKYKGMIIVVLIFAATLALATLGDLQISHALADLEDGKYYSKNFFAVLFEIIGETPVYILPSIALWVIIRYVRIVASWKDGLKVAAYVVCIIAIVGLNFYGSHKVIKYLATHTALFKSETLKFVLTVIFTFIFAALWLFVATRFKEENLESLAICSLIVIFTMGLSQVLVQGIKPFFGRARYRLMNLTNSFKEYTPWYKINGSREVSQELLALGAADDGYKSFPSGHTAAAGVTIAVLSLIDYFDLKKGAKFALYFLTVGYTVTVGVSRIVMGAHYLSDVTVGAFLAVFSFWVGRKLVKVVLDKIAKRAEEVTE